MRKSCDGQFVKLIGQINIGGGARTFASTKIPDRGRMWTLPGRLMTMPAHSDLHLTVSPKSFGRYIPRALERDMRNGLGFEGKKRRRARRHARHRARDCGDA